MKKNKNIVIVLIIILIVVGSVGFVMFFNKGKNISSNNNNNVISSSNVDETIDTKINTDDGDQKINWENYEEYNITISESLNISEAGIYNLTGTIGNGCITVDTTGVVKVILNNINITNLSGPAIYVKQAEDVVIQIEGINNLVDGTSYYGFAEDVNGVIFSSDDLTLQGSGTLNITGNLGDGIVSKDDLKIIEGIYKISSTDDAIRGKDSVYIVDGEFEIESKGDAIKSTNDTDTEKGFILIEKGKFNINAELDGIQAETKLVIDNGDFNITTGGGSKNANSSNEDWGFWGRGPFETSNTNTNDTNSSAKGLKSTDNLVINNGNFVFDTSDDAIHSNNYVGIVAGTFEISSGDDGIHADNELIIDGGIINITKSYEGLEAAKITVNNGDINIVASDDGINVAGGMDQSSMDRRGANNFSSNSNNTLIINNGKITVDATGDGIDVNGSAYINYGDVTVYGPTNDGNGVLDYDREFQINGGKVIAAGSSGMAQSASGESQQYTVMIYFSANLDSEDRVIIKDGSGNEILNFSSAKSYSLLMLSSEELKENSSYNVYVNDSLHKSFEINSIVTSVGNNGGGFMNNMGPGGGRR